MQAWLNVDSKPISYQHAHAIIENEQGHKLWLGDYSSADDFEYLNSKHIKTVISIVSGPTPDYSHSPMTHHKYLIRDLKNQNIFIYFDRVSDQIQKALKSGSVLVHCGAGVSRSAAFVIGFLMKTQRLSFHQALNYCKKKRPVVCPNLGFEKQLKLYEKSLNIKRTRSQERELPMLANLRAGSQLHKKEITLNHNKIRPNLQSSFIRRKPDSSQTLGFNNSAYKNGNEISTLFNEQYLRKIAAFRFGLTLQAKNLQKLPHF